MTKSELLNRTENAYQQTHDALQTVYDALPPGQQRTVARDPKVKSIFERYGVEAVT